MTKIYNWASQRGVSFKIAQKLKNAVWKVVGRSQPQE